MHWKLSVRDEGPGVPYDKRSAVFDKYTRLKNRDNQVAGTGLGLAICQAIATLHKGSIGINDNPAHPTGADFTLTLPRVCQPASLDNAA